MKTTLKNRQARFYIEDGCLLQTVTAGGGDNRTYTHRCSKATFEKVAHAIGETAAQGDGTSMTQIARQENVTFTQTNVAMEFLKERGIVDVRHRRSYPATKDVYLDAMVEFHALAEEPQNI